MPDPVIFGWLLSISFMDTGKYREIQMEGPSTCKAEIKHLMKHNRHLRLQCAYRREPPVFIDYD